MSSCYDRLIIFSILDLLPNTEYRISVVCVCTVNERVNRPQALREQVSLTMVYLSGRLKEGWNGAAGLVQIPFFTVHFSW